MKTQNKVPSVNLQKSSILFMQLGLILALLFVYLTLEHKSFYKIKQFKRQVAIVEPTTKTFDTYIIERAPEKAKPKKAEAIKVQEPKVLKIADKLKVVANETKKLEETLFKPVDTNQDEKIVPTATLIASSIPSVDDGPEEPKKALPFIKVEKAPTFPGCEKETTNQGRIACFNKKIRKHIDRKFNKELAQELGLDPGKQKIRIQFIIEKNGEITIDRVSAPHIKLEKEAKRIINLLPRMLPAEQRLKKVPVRYNLPIVFNIEDE